MNPIAPMEQIQISLSDLPEDLLHGLLILVAKSSNGAADILRIMSARKQFMNLSTKETVLRTVNFTNVKLSGRYEHFQHINGLLSRCAVAGNTAAKLKLAKVIIASFSLLWKRSYQTNEPFLRYYFSCHPFDNRVITEERANAALSFVKHFSGEHPCSSNSFCGNICHLELVRSFLCLADPSDIFEMELDLKNYARYVFGDEVVDCPQGSPIIRRLTRFKNKIKSFKPLARELELEFLPNFLGLMDAEREFNPDCFNSYAYFEDFWSTAREDMVHRLARASTEEFESIRKDVISAFDELPLKNR